ncbi:hypothetical protein [Escherichia coli]|nr:hypothetical protein [Escherichia coli]
MLLNRARRLDYKIMR